MILTKCQSWRGRTSQSWYIRLLCASLAWRPIPHIYWSVVIKLIPYILWTAISSQKWLNTLSKTCLKRRKGSLQNSISILLTPMLPWELHFSKHWLTDYKVFNNMARSRRLSSPEFRRKIESLQSQLLSKSQDRAPSTGLVRCVRKISLASIWTT